MPREKQGVERVEIELPARVAARVRKEAGSRRISATVARILAERYGIAYTPPALGRPRKPAEA